LRVLCARVGATPIAPWPLPRVGRWYNPLKIMPWLFSAVPYLLAIGTIALGAFEIIKDWNDYEESRLKIAVASVFIAVAALSLVGLYHDNQEKKAAQIEVEKAKTKADEDMKALQGKVDAAKESQEDNTRLFVDKFGQMSAQVSDLKADVKTEALQKKLAAVQAELQKSMAPVPKAELAFSFVPFQNGPSPAPAVLAKEVTAAPDSGGVVHIEFSVVNMTGVDALDVAANIEICDVCKFAKEPPGLTRLQGMRETMRLLNIPDLHALTTWEPIGLDIIPRPDLSQMKIGFQYRCRTCALYLGLTPETSGTIHIVRP
jgi:hypothetical protein